MLDKFSTRFAAFAVIFAALYYGASLPKALEQARADLALYHHMSVGAE